VYVHIRKSTSDKLNKAKCASDALSQKNVEISQHEVQVLAKGRQQIEQVCKTADRTGLFVEVIARFL